MPTTSFQGPICTAVNHTNLWCHPVGALQYYYSSHRNIPLLWLITGVIMRAKTKSTFTPKTGYQPLFPSRGPVSGDLAVKLRSVVGTRCLQRWRFLCGFGGPFLGPYYGPKFGPMFLFPY